MPHYRSIMLALCVLGMSSSAFALDMPGKQFHQRKEDEAAAAESARSTADGLNQLVIEQHATNQLIRELITEIRTDRIKLNNQIQQAIQIRAAQQVQQQQEQKRRALEAAPLIQQQLAPGQTKDIEMEGWEELN